MLTIGYVRVSTDRQAEHGVSLEAQEAKIRAMATVQGAELIDVIVDGGKPPRASTAQACQRGPP
jgi:site-specific DNA recombinase